VSRDRRIKEHGVKDSRRTEGRIKKDRRKDKEGRF
jgi:hypothetical protein